MLPQSNPRHPRYEQYHTPEVRVERMNRIRLSVYAYAYECLDSSIISDPEYDRLSFTIRPEIETGHPVMDEFFRTKFDPHTGMWVREHPEIHKLDHYARTHFKQVMADE